MFFQPFVKSDLNALRGLGFGAGASYTTIATSATGLPNTTGGTLPGTIRRGSSSSLRLIPCWEQWLRTGCIGGSAPQAYYYYGAFGLLAEYTISHQAVLNAGTGGRAELEIGLAGLGAMGADGRTGLFHGHHAPKRPFDPRIGQWGAWQLVARYGQLNIDQNAFPFSPIPALPPAARTSWSVGINWWLNKNIRLLTSFSHTTFKRWEAG